MNRSESRYFATAARMDEAFLTLLAKKDFEYITVKEICEVAEVNRSTFYLHYETMSDLLSESVSRMNEQFLACMEKDSDAFSAKLRNCPRDELYLITPDYLTPYLSYIKNNKRLFRTATENAAVLGMDKSYDKMFRYVFTPILDRYGVLPQDRPYIMAFYIRGLMANPMAYKMIANPIMNEYMSYTSADFLEMNMIPKEITDGCGEYVIAEYYHVDRLQSFLKVDFLKGLMAGHHIRRCEHCGRFFLMTKGYKTRYCDKAAPENPRFTCNQMAYRTVRIKEENADNPKYQSYRRCLNRVMRSYQRKVIDEKQKSVLLRQAEELYHRAMTSPEFSNEEFEQQMQSENLYKLCGFDVPKRGRPKAVKNDK